MIFVVGGGGPSASDAILTVTVPTGSTVTMTKSGVTLTPTMWVQAANNTLNCALFVIAPAQFSATTPWTVTATLGTDSATDTVLINSNKRYDVELDYSLHIVRSGVVKTELQKTDGTITSYSGYTKWQLNRTVSLLYLEVGNVTRFDKMTLTVRGGQSWRGGQTPGVGISSSVPTIDFNSGSVNPYSVFTALNNGSGSISSGTYEVDVSGISGRAVVWIFLSYENAIPNPYVDIVNWYLD